MQAQIDRLSALEGIPQASAEPDSDDDGDEQWFTEDEWKQRGWLF